ncbi:MAG: hypothetical protein H8D22_00135 [Candidatus Cloacimonetes bacterium]|nr:hypothetical protein [Candidatus Cloacimonadota bacterium]
MEPKIHVLQEKDRLPHDFWEDHKWALEHYGDLREKYADMWVAIANKKVVAFGENLTDKKEESICREIGRSPVTLFVEGQARIL